MQRLGLSQRALAEKLAVSQGQVMQALKLLELPPAVQESIDAGEVAPTIGYEIAKVADPGRQVELAGKVARGEAGRAEVRELTVEAPRPKRLELHARRRGPGHRHDPRPGDRCRGGRREAPGGAQASQRRGRPIAERRGLIGPGGAVAGGPDGSAGPVREILPVAPTAATIDRAWCGRW